MTGGLPFREFPRFRVSRRSFSLRECAELDDNASVGQLVCVRVSVRAECPFCPKRRRLRSSGSCQGLLNDHYPVLGAHFAPPRLDDPQGRPPHQRGGANPPTWWPRRVRSSGCWPGRLNDHYCVVSTHLARPIPDTRPKPTRPAARPPRRAAPPPPPTARSRQRARAPRASVPPTRAAQACCSPSGSSRAGAGAGHRP